MQKHLSKYFITRAGQNTKQALKAEVSANKNMRRAGRKKKRKNIIRAAARTRASEYVL